MINIRWSSIAGGSAFVLSFLIGLGSGAGLFALVRALIFGVFFFALASGIYWLINQFLSDLLAASPGGADETFKGSQVNITVEEDGGADSLPSYRAPDAALDQEAEAGYTRKEDTGGGAAFDLDAIEEGADPSNAAIPTETEGEAAVDTLPDLEGIGAYQSLTVEDTMDISTEPPAPSRKPSVNSAKPMELDGDFRPKEMATAIQTLLKRE